MQAERHASFPIRFFLTFLGAAVYAGGLNLFILPLHLYSGGLVGLAQVMSYGVNKICPVDWGNVQPYGILFFLLNLPIIILAWKKLTQQFFLRSLAGTIAIALFTMIIPVPSASFVPEESLSILIGGVLSGVGIGILLTSGGSGGGIEVVGVWLAKAYPRLTVGKVDGIFNFLLFGAYFFLFDVKVVIESLLYMVLYAMALDKFHYQTINSSVMVFTKKNGIDALIMAKTGRGVTEWHGYGAYTGEVNHIFVTVINKYEERTVLALIHQIDPDAFVIIQEGIRVYGNFQRRLLS